MSKKIKNIFLCCSLFSLAQVYGSQQSPPILYCPQQVTCSLNGDLASCKAIGVFPEYWKIISNEGDVITGLYSFKKVKARYHTPHLSVGGNVTCQYSNVSGRIERLISIRNIYQNNFEAFYDESTQWNIVGYDAECTTTDFRLCPLVEKPEIVFVPINISPTVGGAVEFYPISHRQTSIKSPVSYDAARSNCKSSPSNCKFHADAYSSYYGSFPVGTITVDVSKVNEIRIVEISQDMKNRKCRMQWKKPFNTLVCVK